jgi:purine nucleosidase
MKRIPVFVDTDLSLGIPRAEIDDGAALIALLNSPEVEVCGISTVHGNAPVDQCYANTLRLLHVLDRTNIKVSRGAAEPLIADLQWRSFLKDWRQAYGPPPPWELPPDIPDAIDHIIESIQAFTGKLSILALGPLTNLAAAYQKVPAIAGSVHQVIIMGGSINDQPTAEFNIRCDPEAAEIVLSAGWPIRMLGLHITRQVHFSTDFFSSLSDDNPGLSLLKKGALEWIPVVEAQGWEQDGCSLHDAVAAVALIEPNHFDFIDSTASIETAGSNRGVLHLSSPGQGQAKNDQNQRLKVAVRIEIEKCKHFIEDRLQPKER